MRECGLTGVPASLAGLTRLHSLLMGYNSMTEVGGRVVVQEAAERKLCSARGPLPPSPPSSLPPDPRFQPARHVSPVNPHVPVQRPFLPPGPYLRSLRFLALSDSKGFQDDSPWDEMAGPLTPATSLEVLRINRCLGLQPSIEGA